MQIFNYRNLSYTLVIFSFIVIQIGAYTRLSDAGLGCPDWPGCYGKMIAPTSDAEIKYLESAYSTTTKSAYKAWVEMSHRYVAGSLGLCILLLCFYRMLRNPQSWVLPTLLASFVIIQALLGKWTVTLKLHPLIVLSHLAGGIGIMALLLIQVLYFNKTPQSNYKDHMHSYMTIGIILVAMQILLGGWVSANYAALACVGFPTCNGLWLPSMSSFGNLSLFLDTSLNYSGGILSSEERITIHMMHRIGALIVSLYLCYLFIKLKVRDPQGRWVILALLIIQVLLGITNVVNHLPLPIAVAHQGVGVLLLIALIYLRFSNSQVIK